MTKRRAGQGRREELGYEEEKGLTVKKRRARV